MPLRKRLVEQGLRNKGFVVDQGKDLKFRYFHQGRYTGCWTKVSHGSDYEIGDNLLGQMKKQLGLRSSREVQGLCDCTLSLDRYNEILRELGHL
ncbi:MAG: hypothetical protein HY922_01155 [Elusimicrobia bacterium]|nr:hypothetical protein [Elusimicrobiota bacterium]